LAGIIFVRSLALAISIASVADRVVLFLDYQNVYKGAREAFHPWGAPFWEGQVDPERLGDLIIQKAPQFNRELTQIRIYRGQPDPEREKRAFAANDRQCSYWRDQQACPRTHVTTRTLQYPSEWPREKAREKGTDVALAIDFVAMAVRGQYEVGILMSADTDLKPALEFVHSLPGTPFPRCEVAAWSSETGYSRRLSISGARIWCHWLDRSDYRAVADQTDYTQP
jgi:uncharacterized LabA/DUF88 family protein